MAYRQDPLHRPDVVTVNTAMILSSASPPSIIWMPLHFRVKDDVGAIDVASE